MVPIDFQYSDLLLGVAGDPEVGDWRIRTGKSESHRNRAYLGCQHCASRQRNGGCQSRRIPSSSWQYQDSDLAWRHSWVSLNELTDRVLDVLMIERTEDTFSDRSSRKDSVSLSGSSGGVAGGCSTGCAQRTGYGACAFRWHRWAGCEQTYEDQGPGRGVDYRRPHARESQSGRANLCTHCRRQ